MIESIRYATSFQTVDCCVIKNTSNDYQLLFGRKPAEVKFRFIGGFVDPSDLSLEDAAKRELKEEAGSNLEVSNPVYLFSNRQDDPRYRNSEHKILTAMMKFNYLFGFPEAGDDIAEIKWIDVDLLKTNYKTLIVETHHPLVKKLIETGII